MTTESELLNVEQLRVYYSTKSGLVKAVDGVDLRIMKGEVVGIIGESGCGKSTLAFSMLRLLPVGGKIMGGKISFNGKDLVKLSEGEMRRVRGKEIAITFQDPLTYLNPVLTINDQLFEAAQTSPSGRQKMILEALEQVRIASPQSILKSYPHQLSGGMRQRVLIAMSLLFKPSLLILDEPTSSLDATIQVQILNLIKELTKQLGVSTLMITHNLGIAADICDKVNVMYAGKIVELADVFTIFENPLHPYTIGLLDSTLTTERAKGGFPTIEGSVPNLIQPPTGCRFHPRCSKRKKICSHMEPTHLDVGNKHVVSCWLYSQGGGKDEPN